MHTFKKLAVALSVAVPCSVLAAAGDLDVTFSGDGVVDWSAAAGRPLSVKEVAVQADGKILGVGTATDALDANEENNGITRFFADGTIDTSFGVNGVISTDIPALGVSHWDNWATDIVIQSDGKFIVGGGVWTRAASYESITLARYNADGSLDTTFAGTGYVVLDFGFQDSETLNDVKLQTDGKIVVTGTVFVPGSGRTPSQYRFGLARFNANGSLDMTFSSDGLVTTSMGTADSNAYELAIQGDGKLVVAGAAYQGTTQKYDIAVARYLSSDGSLDTSFGVKGKAYVNFANKYDYGSAIALQADGKILIAGQVDSDAVGGASKFGVVRLTTAGKLDTSFDGDGKVITPFLGYDFANDVLVQGDGKVVVVGGTRQPDSTYAPVVARYNVNGSLDSTFSGDGKVQSSIAGYSSSHVGVVLDGNGKIVTTSVGHGMRYLSQ